MDYRRLYPEAPEFIGLSVEAAKALCAARHFDGPRIVFDDRPQALTSDLRPNRLNLYVVSGKVEKAAMF